MSNFFTLKWDHGEIKISKIGCMMTPKFKLGKKIVEPLHTAEWINDETKKYNKLPGILRKLSGEFPCVPFGINDSIEEITEEWKNTFSIKPYIVNEPHGYAANHNWDVINLTNNKAQFKINYPAEDNVDYLIRSIEVDSKHPLTIKCSLTIAVKNDCTLPIGFHPMIKVPPKKNMIKIIPGKFKFGLTCPGLIYKDKTAGAIGKEFNSIERVPGFENKFINLSSPPFEGNYEDLFQLCGADGNISIENYEDNFCFTYNWNPSHFSSLLMWLSNKGRKEYPWRSNHVTMGLEPICSAFGFSPHVSCNPNNPIHSRGIPTCIKFYKKKLWKTEYQFSIRELKKQ